MPAHVQRGVGHAHDRRVLAAVRAHRAQLEAVQAVHAAVAAGEVGRPQPRLVAGRADRAEVDVSSCASQPRDEETVGAVAVRERLQVLRHGRMLPDRDARLPRSSAGIRRERPGTRHDVLVLGGRDRARRVDEGTAGPNGGRSGGEDVAPAARPAPAGRPALRQRASGREASVPRSLHGGSTSTRSNASPAAARRRRPCGRRRSSRPYARRSGAARRRGRGGARRRRSRPRCAISAARWVVLPPGAAHRSSTRSPGCGRERARDGHRGARLRHQQARLPLGRARTRRTARRGSAPPPSARVGTGRRVGELGRGRS